MLAGFSFLLGNAILQTAEADNLQTALASEPPDLPIEIPYLHVTPIHKLPSDLQGLFICVGINGLVRCYAIISINQVSPIRRHVVLLAYDNV
jgi:hypothetical protein